MNGKKGRRPKLTDDIKQWIVTHQQGRKKKLKATHMRADVRDFIEKELRKQNKERELPWTEELIQSEVKNCLPGISAIQKFLNPVNKMLEEKPSPLDKPWHLGLLTKIKEHPEYYISPGAIQSVLDALTSQKMLTRHKGVTIRQALWVSRLYTKVKQKDELWRIAWHYAFKERISEIADIDFDTTEYDHRLSNPKELIKYFDTRMHSVDFKTYKRAFEEITCGVKYAGVSFPVEFMLFVGDKILAPIRIQDKPIYIELPLNDQKALLNALEKQHFLKETKQLDASTLVVLKKPLPISFENKEFNEYLHNLIKDGEK